MDYEALDYENLYNTISNYAFTSGRSIGKTAIMSQAVYDAILELGGKNYMDPYTIQNFGPFRTNVNQLLRDKRGVKKLKAQKRRRKKAYVKKFLMKQNSQDLATIIKYMPDFESVLDEDSITLIEASMLVQT